MPFGPARLAWENAVEQEAHARKCTRSEAIRHLNRTKPELRQAMLAEANANRPNSPYHQS